MENIIMETVNTATGKEFSCDYFNSASALGRLSIRLKNISLVDVAAVFGDPAETAVLHYGGRSVEKYTNLIYIAPEGDAIRVTLRKE